MSQFTLFYPQDITFSVRALFIVWEMTALCIRSRISPLRALNSSLIASSTSVDHPHIDDDVILPNVISWELLFEFPAEGAILDGFVFLLLFSFLRSWSAHFCVCVGAVSQFFSHAKQPRWFSWSSSHLAARSFPFSVAPLQPFWGASAPSVLSRHLGCGKLRSRVIPNSSANILASLTRDWWPWCTAFSSNARTNLIVESSLLYSFNGWHDHLILFLYRSHSSSSFSSSSYYY